MANPSIEAPSEEIGWDQLDLKRFAVGSTLMFLMTRTIVYPFSLVKTRLQVQEKGVYTSTSHAFAKIAKTEGIRGLYKGFMTVAVGIVPAQGAYITAYEVTKSAVQSLPGPLGTSAVANFAGGVMSALASATVGVPLDVISSRLMIQSPAGELTHRHYRGGLNALVSIFKEEGIRGLYRGYGASLITYAPTSAVWWTTYGLVRPIFFPLAKGNGVLETLAAAWCGAIAGATSACVTNPLDVAKTRLQTQEFEGGVRSTRNIFGMLRNIYAHEGLVALWRRGLSARMVSMAINGSILILTYENVKKLSLKTSESPTSQQSQ